MKRFTLLFVLLYLGVSSALFAEKVEMEQARQVGKNFYYERINIKEHVSFDAIQITGEMVISENDLPVYYIFNMNNQGFIVVTADDRVAPIIAYSFEKPWPTGDLPAHVAYWMNGQKGDILTAIEEDYPANAAIENAWTFYGSPDAISLPDAPLDDVGPLLLDEWNQDFPNNAMCPEDPAAGGSYGGRVPVGCVATAMTQIMNYWRYPETGQGSHCITPIQPQYGQQCADFANTTYEWNGMTTTPNKECDPLALLSWHGGISVDMSYGPTGSGTYTSKAASALRNYFKYSNMTSYAQKYVYSTTAWNNMMQDDLDQLMPIEYSGQGVDGGHAWVCDGYQGTDYYHMNWGWGGSYNGYFYLTALTPGGSSFNGSQSMVYNIEPNPAYYPTYCSGQTDLVTYDFGSFEDGSGPVEDYENNLNCSWLIAPDDAVETVDLDFLRFDLASGDEVKVYDGNSASATLIGTYTGSTLPGTITSTGPAMFVTFTTDASGTGQGFLAEYDCNLINFCESSTNLWTQTGDLSDGSGPDYEYRNGTLCKWYIRPVDAVSITLDFSFFNTEETNDKVQVYDLISGDLLGTFSGELDPPPTVTANHGEMLVMWNSNKVIRGEGWDASYTIVVGTEESEAVQKLNVYPNPASDYLNIAFDASGVSSVQMDLLSVQGKTVFTQTIPGGQKTFTQQVNISELTQGIYLLRLTSEKGVTITKVVVH
jgi:hypothetical protein